MTIHPTILNHNAAVAANVILHQEAPSKLTELAQNVFDRAVSGSYKAPIEVQAAAYEMNNVGGKVAAQSAHALASAAELQNKLPIFDVQAMKESGVPQHLTDAAQAMNVKLQTGQDSDSLKSAGDASASPQTPQNA